MIPSISIVEKRVFGDGGYLLFLYYRVLGCLFHCCREGEKLTRRRMKLPD